MKNDCRWFFQRITLQQRNAAATTSQVVKKKRVKKMPFCGRIIQICQLTRNEIVWLKHKYWGNSFLYISFPYSFFTLAWSILWNRGRDSISISSLAGSPLNLSNPTKLAIPLNRDFSFFKQKKKLGQLCCIYGQLSKSMKTKYPTLGAIPLLIWNLTFLYHIFVHPPIPAHASQC